MKSKLSREILEELDPDFLAMRDDRDKMRELLKEALQFCQRIDGDGDPLNIHLARKIHMQLVESV